MANKNHKYRSAQVTDSDRESVIAGTPEPSSKIKDLLQYRRLNQGMSGKFAEKFPEFADVMKNAPADFNERRAYADSIAKDPKYKDMYIKSADLPQYFDNQEAHDSFIGLRKSLPKYVKGEFGTEGTKNQADAYGVRSALLVPNAQTTYEIPGQSKATIKYGLDEKGGMTKELTDFQVNPLNSYLDKKFPKLENGIDTIGGVAQGASILGDVVGTVSKDDNAKTVGNILSGTGSMAAAGASIGGPVGAAVGGGLGLATSIISSVRDKEAKKEADKAAAVSYKVNQTKSKMAPAPNTQADMYEFGTMAANADKPVEVERNEIVMRKNDLGKFEIKADFKGGKSHEQGGEDYQLQEGDVVFPGNKRKTIMRHLKSGNHEGIESERLKLPKDLPQNNELKDGINRENKWAKIVDDAIKSGEFKESDRARLLDDIYSGQASELFPNAPDNYVDRPQESPTYSTFDEVWGIPFQSEGKDDIETQIAKQKETSAAKTQLPEPELPAAKATDASNETFEKADVPGMMDSMAASVEDTFDPREVALRESNPVSGVAPTELEAEAEAQTMLEGGSTFEDIMSYAPAAANVMKGMLSTPEKVDRRYMTPEQIEYADNSANIRRESETQEALDRSNAARFSGGSAQVARAGKALAGSEDVRRKGAINTQEVQRADQINQYNANARSRSNEANINLANQYDTMDAQNKAAVDAYFTQGVSDFGRISNQRKIDKGLKRSQDIALGMIESDRFKYADGKINFKK